MSRLLGYLLVTVLVSGCATYSWRHPTKSENEFPQDKYDCTRQSARLFPVVLQPQVESHATRQSHTSCKSRPGHTDCKTTERSIETPAKAAVDVNSANRNDAYISCLNARGWQYVQDPEPAR